MTEPSAELREAERIQETLHLRATLQRVRELADKVLIQPHIRQAHGAYHLAWGNDAQCEVCELHAALDGKPIPSPVPPE